MSSVSSFYEEDGRIGGQESARNESELSQSTGVDINMACDKDTYKIVKLKDKSSDDYSTWRQRAVIAMKGEDIGLRE